MRVKKWKPIETAPNDTPVLVCGYHRGQYYIADAKLINGDWFLFCVADDEYSMPSEDHTHWMEWPEPPK